MKNEKLRGAIDSFDKRVTTNSEISKIIDLVEKEAVLLGANPNYKRKLMVWASRVGHLGRSSNWFRNTFGGLQALRIAAMQWRTGQISNR